MNPDIKKVLMCVILVIVAYLLFRYFVGANEGFGSLDTTKMVSPSNINDGLIHPLLYEPELSAVISGSNFIGLPDTVIPPWAVNKNGYGESDTLDGDLGNAGLEFNLCSKSCCSAQYPNGIESKPDAFVCGSPDKFVPTTYTCNNAYEDSGCVCMTQKQMDFLNRRGGNA